MSTYACIYTIEARGREGGDDAVARTTGARCPDIQKVHCIYKSFIMNYTMVYLKWEACLVRGYMGYRDYNACGAHGGQTRGRGSRSLQEASEIRAQQPADIACRCSLSRAHVLPVRVACVCVNLALARSRARCTRVRLQIDIAGRMQRLPNKALACGAIPCVCTCLLKRVRFFRYKTCASLTHCRARVRTYDVCMHVNSFIKRSRCVECSILCAAARSHRLRRHGFFDVNL